MRLLPQFVLSACLAALTSCGSDSSAKQPNVLLVTLDTVRADYLSSYGHPGGLTPKLDALAADGTRFEFCISSSAVTPVSHATILTGRYPHNHGLRVLAADGGCRLPDDVPSLASLYKAQGYSTAAVHSSFAVSDWFGLAQGFDHFDSFDSTVELDEQGARWDESHQRRADDTTDRVLALLEDFPEPWFVWIHYWDPHDPLIVPPDEFLPEDIPRFEKGRYAGRVRPTDLQYAEELRYVDGEFGRILDRLKERDLYEDSIVVVTSDHGEGLSDGAERHDWTFHRILYQEQIHVPLIVKAPGTASTECDSLVRTADIFPTLLELSDLPVPGEFDGASLVGLMSGDSEEPRFAYADQINGYDFNAKMLQKRPHADFLHCAMDRDWKLIYRPNFPEMTELYSLRDDPLEERNLANEQPAQVRRLLEQLAREEGWVTAPLEGGEAPSEASLKILEKLGYTGGTSASARDARWGWRCPESETIHDEPGDCAESGLPMIPVRRSE